MVGSVAAGGRQRTGPRSIPIACSNARRSNGAIASSGSCASSRLETASSAVAIRRLERSGSSSFPIPQ